ncbi:hypothetical protein CERSUDRAFT_113361 [Gelatoporia subvermispora B]|uniref:CSN8/PSMD8/EIF3K domain-containing protein n=1 Tax=Ceriporiopsis subvermispora (strain B) TaxID=914234 RepID=M2RHA6_CERS8|nr:hypothetical protein CERSUDRAFT_113361 [Gelatoporia subvermispora B]
MTGPPTPPPTTQVEIEDATRDVMIAEATPDQAGTQPVVGSAPFTIVDRPSVATGPGAAYQRFIPLLNDAARKRDFEALIQVAERGDYTARDDHHQNRLLLTTVLVLAYLIKNDIPPARHALTRLPQGLTSHPLSQVLFSLLASVWNRKYTAVYARAEELHTLLLLPDFPDAELGSMLAELTTLFVEVFRQQTFGLLSSAYASLPLSLAEVYFGLPSERILEISARHDWSYDASSQILTPGRAKNTSRLRYQSIAPSNLTSFQVIIDSAALLD